MLETRPLATTFGAEVLDFPISLDTLAADGILIKTLWAEHKLLLFRNQQLDEPALVRFSRFFGDLEIHVRTEYLWSIRVSTSPTFRKMAGRWAYWPIPR